MVNSPTITIAVACYNYGIYLEDCLKSIFEQEVSANEVIVLNDGSTDDTEIIVRGLQKKYNFTYISQNNQGIVSVRNKFITNTNTDYLIQLDADDTIPKNYVAEISKVIISTPADIVYTPVYNLETKEIVVAGNNFNSEELKRHNFIHASSAVSCKRLANVKYDKELDKIGLEDWDLFLNLILTGSSAVLAEKTHLNYRIHDQIPSRSMQSRSGINQLKAMAYIYKKYSSEYVEEMGGFEWISDNIMNALNIIGMVSEKNTHYEQLLENNRLEAEQRTNTLQNELSNIKNSKKWKIMVKAERIIRGKR